MTETSEQATLGGGCFWCLDALYRRLKGVELVVSGYAGGTTENPTYDSLHDRDTGHAEVIQVTFEPSIITYQQLLEIFFTMHDPTTPNRQGNDVGPMYRSIILYADDEQKRTAEDIMQNFAAELWDKPLVTELKPLEKFWPAEDYQQDYFNKNPSAGYCQVIINPKLAKFRQKFAALLND